MTRRVLAVLIAAIVLPATAAVVVPAQTATIGVVPGNVVYDKTHTIVISDLIPSACPTTITSIANGATNSAIWGSIGGNATSVWLWNSKNQTTVGGGANMNAGGGNDCLVPGGVRANANLTVGGGNGTDYCYNGPGPGAYTLNSCQGNTGGNWFNAPYVTRTLSNPSFS